MPPIKRTPTRQDFAAVAKQDNEPNKAQKCSAESGFVSLSSLSQSRPVDGKRAQLEMEGRLQPMHQASPSQALSRVVSVDEVAHQPLDPNTPHGRYDQALQNVKTVMGRIPEPDDFEKLEPFQTEILLDRYEQCLSVLDEGDLEYVRHKSLDDYLYPPQELRDFVDSLNAERAPKYWWDMRSW